MKKGRGLYMGKKRDYNALFEFDRLTKEDQSTLMGWLSKHVQPRKSPNPQLSSYRLKHEMARDIKLYVPNGAIKKAMLKLGYWPEDKQLTNCVYSVNFIRDGKVLRRLPPSV